MINCVYHLRFVKVMAVTNILIFFSQLSGVDSYCMDDERVPLLTPTALRWSTLSSPAGAISLS